MPTKLHGFADLQPLVGRAVVKQSMAFLDGMQSIGGETRFRLNDSMTDGMICLKQSILLPLGLRSRLLGHLVRMVVFPHGE